MRGTTPWTEKQKLAMLPYKSLVGETYRTLDWLRDSIRDEDREGFGSALKALRNLLSELEASLLRSFDQRREDRNDTKKI